MLVFFALAFLTCVIFLVVYKVYKYERLCPDGFILKVKPLPHPGTPLHLVSRLPSQHLRDRHSSSRAAITQAGEDGSWGKFLWKVLVGAGEVGRGAGAWRDLWEGRAGPTHPWGTDSEATTGHMKERQAHQGGCPRPRGDLGAGPAHKPPSLLRVARSWMLTADGCLVPQGCTWHTAHQTPGGNEKNEGKWGDAGEEGRLGGRQVPGGLAPVPIHPVLGTSPGSELSRASVKRNHHHFQGLVLLMSLQENPIVWH